MPPDDAQDAYFMTRDHARLLADLSAAAAASGSMTVIHGESGLGKTRLLRAFIELRCADGDWLAIDFLPQGMVRLRHPGGEGTPLPQHELATALNASARAKIWLVDGFELALPQGREILYATWQSRQPSPALVLAGRLDWPVAWRRVLPPEPPQLKVARVSPLSDDESRDYLDQRVCGSPGMTLPSSGRVRRILRDCGGRIPLLREAAADLDASDCRPLQVPPAGRRRWLLPALLVLVAVLVAGLWRARLDVLSPDASLPVVAPAEQPVDSSVTDATPTDGNAVRDEPAPIAAPALRSAPAQQSSPEPTGPAGQVIVPGDSAAEDRARPELLATKAPPAGQAGRFAGFAAYPLLHERLEATDRWLRDPEADGWSIQLMTLNSDDTAARALERHLRGLSERGVDLDRLWVYRAPAAGGRKGHIGLLYGRYASQKQAQRASRSLPTALRVERTLLRSARSLRRDSGLLPVD